MGACGFSVSREGSTAESSMCKECWIVRLFGNKDSEPLQELKFENSEGMIFSPLRFLAVILLQHFNSQCIFCICNR